MCRAQDRGHGRGDDHHTHRLDGDWDRGRGGKGSFCFQRPRRRLRTQAADPTAAGEVGWGGKLGRVGKRATRKCLELGAAACREMESLGRRN